MNFKTRNERFDIRLIFSWISQFSRTNVLPVALATLGDFEATVQYLLTFDHLSTKPLELLTICECDQVIGFAIDVDVDKECFLFLDPNMLTPMIDECMT